MSIKNLTNTDADSFDFFSLKCPTGVNIWYSGYLKTVRLVDRRIHGQTKKNDILRNYQSKKNVFTKSSIYAQVK